MSSVVASVTSATSSSTASATCITATPDKNGHVPVDDCRALYNYYPSLAAAIIFCVVFGISLVIHVTQAVKWKKRFCWVIIMGVTWELAAFILRALSTRHQINQAFFIPSFLLIFLAPLWINAFDYMLLGRMIYYYIPNRSVFRVPATALTKIFVFFDVIAFLIQVTGGVMASSGPGTNQSTINLGLHIYMGGIALQQFAILIFSSLAVRLHMHLIKLDREGQLWQAGKERGWRKLMYTLYASLTFITIRIIFRLIEYSPAGESSNIQGKEVLFYTLDSVPMAFAAYLINIFHPGPILVGPDSEFPKKSRKEKKEEKRVKKEEKMRAKEEKKREKEVKKAEKNGEKHAYLEMNGGETERDGMGHDAV